MKISRRQSLGAAFGLGLGLTGVATKAQAALQCQNVPTMYGPMRDCIAGLPSPLIHVAAITNNQYQSQWCWAACIAMVFAYYGHPVSQQRIVQETFGVVVNMPGQPWQILSALNRGWTDDYGVPFSVTSGNGSTDAATAASDLVGNQPLITALEYAAPIVQGPFGLTTGQPQITAATVRDPWPGNGQRILSAQEWMSIMFAARIRVT